jgi:asparagine synthase (glutamine-hydrolysing)
MCGIAGFLDRRGASGGERLAAVGSAMASSLRHRGPDDSGVWVDPAAGISLAHRRLAILDLSPAGRQPMLSSCGRLVLTYNGEIYNYTELRHELAAAGRVFRGHSDSEVLVEACAEWGVAETLKRINGMFAFAVWDRKTRTLFLARDRIGIKPLYWARFGDLFLFGSELKALLAHGGWRPEIDRKSLRAYMRRGHVPAPFSIYRGVHKLQAGELLVYGAKGEPEISSYWDPAKIVAEAQAHRLDVGEAEAIDGLDALLRDAVGRQMASDVPLGAFLSGGIDSSLVVALMQAQSSRPVNTFTIGFGEKSFDEASHARSVAEHLGTTHTELRASPADALDLVPELARCFDEPLSSRSEIPTMLVSKLARRHVTVALSGDGGDEVFGGYGKYYSIAAVARAIGYMPGPLRHLTADAVQGVLSGMAAVHGLLPAAWRPRLSLNRVATIAAAVRASGDFNTIYRETRNAALAPAAFLVGTGERPLRWEAGPHVDVVADPMERMGYFDVLTLLVDSILTKVDRASMAHSLEVRVPLLDHRVVEYAWRLPPKLKYGRRSENKRLLRHLLYRYVPREIVDRPKKGFSSPIAIWLRGPLRAWADELLDERRMKESGFFDSSQVHACWREHLRGSSDHWRLLWGILMFEQWRRQWAIAPAGVATQGAAAAATTVVKPSVELVGDLHGA